MISNSKVRSYMQHGLDTLTEQKTMINRLISEQIRDKLARKRRTLSYQRRTK